MSVRTVDELMGDLEDVLRNFHGREFSGPIGPDTWFFADLGLASIDAVVLGEALEERYGRKLPFGELMGELGGRADRDVQLGEFVDFLYRNLNAN